jgi:large subunit ribosomal protein L28
MGMKCDYCGKTVSFGKQISRRGKAKYLGGVGKKIAGITRRKFKPNLQQVRTEIDGKKVRRSACVQCIRSGIVIKRVVRKPFAVKHLAAG